MTPAAYRPETYEGYLPPGNLLGRYELVRPVAVGGMAEVYLARARGVGIEGFEKYVIVKRIQPRLSHDPVFRSMFRDEARLAASLNHPNIVQTFDMGSAEGSLFIAMEFVQGRHLGELLAEASKRHSHVPFCHALKIVIDAASALHAAHETRSADGSLAHVVHRDVSPSNILVSFNGCVKLLDFGIAKSSRRETHTGAGLVKGKISYMSPEQCRAEPLDHRSDVFSLGIILYELTTGRKLFNGRSDLEILNRIAQPVIPPPGEYREEFPRELERIVLRCLEGAPDRRYQTAQELQLDLEQYVRKEHLKVSAVGFANYVRGMFPREFAHSRLDTVPPVPRADVAPQGTPPQGSNRMPGLIEVLSATQQIDPCDIINISNLCDQPSSSLDGATMVSMPPLLDEETVQRPGIYQPIMVEGARGGHRRQPASQQVAMDRSGRTSVYRAESIHGATSGPGTEPVWAEKLELSPERPHRRISWLRVCKASVIAVAAMAATLAAIFGPQYLSERPKQRAVAMTPAVQPPPVPIVEASDAGAAEDSGTEASEATERNLRRDRRRAKRHRERREQRERDRKEKHLERRIVRASSPKPPLAAMVRPSATPVPTIRPVLRPAPIARPVSPAPATTAPPTAAPVPTRRPPSLRGDLDAAFPPAN